MNKRYDLRVKAQGRAELLIYGDIGDDWMSDESNDAKSVISALNEIESSQVDIRINSYGGIVADGIAIYNALRRKKSVVTTYIDGVAFSIASLIAMGGDRIVMAENGMMMIHAPWGGAVGNAKDMRDTADMLDKFADAMTSSYLRPNGPDEDTVAGWLADGEDHFFTAAEAVEIGLADSLGESVDIAASLRDMSSRYKIPAVRAAFQPEAAMADTETPAVPDTPTVDPVQTVRDYNAAESRGRDAGAKAEAQRQKEVRSVFQMRAFAAPQVQTVLDQCLEDTSCNKAMALERALAAVEALPGNAPIDSRIQPQNDGGAFSPIPPGFAPTGGHRQVSGGTNRMADGIRIALEIRSGLLKDREALAKERRQNEFLSMSLVDLMAREIRAAGGRVGGTREDIARSYVEHALVYGAGPSHGTDHLAGIMADVANKSALQGWDEADETWNTWVQQGTLNDYREAKRANLALLDKLSKMQENQEWEYGNLADVSQGIQGFFHGKKYGLSIQAIVNDDLSELTRAFAGWGEAASATVGDTVFALLTVSGTGGFGQTMDEDGEILFHASHGNYLASGSGGAPSSDTFAAARTAMAAHADQNQRVVGVRPRWILHGTGLTPAVWTLLNSQRNITGQDVTQGESNWVTQMGLGSVEDYRFDSFENGDSWIFAAARRNVEVSGVAGPLTPRVERSMISNIPGLTYEMSLPFGAAALDYRAFFLNYGS